MNELQRVYLASEEDDRGVASTKYRLGLRLIGEVSGCIIVLCLINRVGVTKL